MNPLKQTAMVVDDDPEIRCIISKYLGLLGFATTEAGDGHTAIAILDEVRPSLLCIDLMLPESSGFDVCEHVRNSPEHQAVRILIVSARAMPEDRATAEDLGIHNYLTKPFTKAQFNAHIRETLRETLAEAVE